MKNKIPKIKSRLARLHRALRGLIPGARRSPPPPELVVRNFPLAFGKALRVDPK